jgi:hypothetical protein
MNWYPNQQMPLAGTHAVSGLAPPLERPLSGVQATPFGQVPTTEGFKALRAALRQSGGIAKGDDLARLLEDHRLGDFISLARLIAHHLVFGFEFHASLWVPMFQFDLRDLSLNYGCAPAVGKLAEVYDGWMLAGWFAGPNPRLNGRRPVDALDAMPHDVLSAACVARARRNSQSIGSV